MTNIEWSIRISFPLSGFRCTCVQRFAVLTSMLLSQRRQQLFACGIYLVAHHRTHNVCQFKRTSRQSICRIIISKSSWMCWIRNWIMCQFDRTYFYVLSNASTGRSRAINEQTKQWNLEYSSNLFIWLVLSSPKLNWIIADCNICNAIGRFRIPFLILIYVSHGICHRNDPNDSHTFCSIWRQNRKKFSEFAVLLRWLEIETQTTICFHWTTSNGRAKHKCRLALIYFDIHSQSLGVQFHSQLAEGYACDLSIDWQDGFFHSHISFHFIRFSFQWLTFPLFI